MVFLIIEDPIIKCQNKDIYFPSDDTFLIIDYFKKNIKDDYFDGLDISYIKNVLDMGTGTGIIAIYLQKIIDMKVNLNANVYGSDILDAALECARINIELNKLKGKIQLINSNLFNSFPNDLRNRFDIIVFNPPYLPTIAKEMDDKTKNFDLTWDGGARGIDVLTIFLNQVRDFIKFNKLSYIYYISSSLSDLDTLEHVIIEKGFKKQVIARKHISFEDIFLNRLKPDND